MTTRTMEGRKISLPRAGLGALLAGTLLAGSLLGAAVYAGFTSVTSNSAALAAGLVAPSRHEPVAIRHARIEAGNGQLVGDAAGTAASATAGEGWIRAIPYRGDGFGGDGFDAAGQNATRVAPYRGDGFGGDGFPGQTADDKAPLHGELR